MSALSPRQLFLSVALLCAIIFVVFSQVIGFEIQNYDDLEYIDNPIIQQGISSDNFRDLLLSPVNSNWHPVTLFSLALDYEFFGRKPLGFHLSNLILHMLTTVFVFLSMRLIFKDYWQSIFIAAIFSVLPLNVESIAWIAERKGLLAGLGFILTLYMHLQYKNTGKIKFYYFSIIFFLLGLLSKASIVFTPILIVIVDFYLLKKSSQFSFHKLKPLLKEKIPYFFIAIIFTVITIYVHYYTGAMESATVIEFSDKIKNTIISYSTYLRQFILPYDLSVFYGYRIDHKLSKVGIILIGLIFITVFFYKIRKHKPYLLFGWLWFIFAIAPTSGIIQTGIHAHADRYMYIPSIGLIIILVVFFAHASAKFRYGQTLFLSLMFGLVLLFMTLSYYQTRHWESPKTLFTKVLKHDETNQLANWHLSTYYLKKQEVDKGLAHYEKVRAVSHNVFGLYQKTARLLLSIPDYELAERVLQDGIQTYPNADVHYRILGRLYAVQNRFKDATPLIRKAISLNPKNPANLRVLTEKYYFEGDYLSAEKYCDELTSRFSYYQYGLSLCRKISEESRQKDN